MTESINHKKMLDIGYSTKEDKLLKALYYLGIIVWITVFIWYILTLIGGIK